ncbi:maleylacetoacetate isomerase [uncultured Tateyamaria sp.]|uniref:maleylacetoacetate isomerase n=1 Tax=uncultured Tateyamaria sp. TaxID=455651 RepID=UPI0026180A29|nr:maleylacetoacetate isomerase [uncultured Tateyamaria sp.]
MTSAPLTLYSYWRSTTSYRVRAALNLKGVAYDIVPVDLVAGDQKADDYAAMNPGKGVPTLVLPDGTVLTQSLAILDYIDAEWPTPPLLPADPVARARVLAAAHTMALDVHPVNNLRVVTHLRDAYDAGTDGAMDWMRHWMTEGFTALEALVQDDTPFAFGTAPDLADLCIVAQVYNARRWGVDLDPFPNVARIEAACLAHPAIAAAHPDQQPDAS